MVWTLHLMNQPIKVQYMSQRLLGQRIRKRYFKTLGTSVIKSPMSPPSLNNILIISGIIPVILRIYPASLYYLTSIRRPQLPAVNYLQPPTASYPPLTYNHKQPQTASRLAQHSWPMGWRPFRRRLSVWERRVKLAAQPLSICLLNNRLWWYPRPVHPSWQLRAQIFRNILLSVD